MGDPFCKRRGTYEKREVFYQNPAELQHKSSLHRNPLRDPQVAFGETPMGTGGGESWDVSNVTAPEVPASAPFSNSPRAMEHPTGFSEVQFAFGSSVKYFAYKAKPRFIFSGGSFISK